VSAVTQKAHSSAGMP